MFDSVSGPLDYLKLLDLALLSQCNHSIFDYGTYGFWSAFLAGGAVVAAAGIRNHEEPHVLAAKLENWTFIPAHMRAGKNTSEIVN